jgi:UDP-N-acetylmuramoyl-tripeptide--D-alanyl-D-alanine ligase
MGQSYKFSFKHLFGKHHYLNLLNCFSLIVEVFNIAPKSVLESAESFKLGSYRGEWRKIKEFDCFLDCYNSNPSSLRASLDSFTSKYKEKIDQTLFVIGDMYELGEESNNYHEAAGKYLQELSLAHVIFIGERAKSFEKGFGQKVQHFKSVDDVTLSQLELTNISTLYLKGSRGVQLEKLLEIFNK